MTTYLSEESANALLTLVKEAKTSGSYDDKIHKLTKSGILPGGQTYSNRVAEPGDLALAEGVAGTDAEDGWNGGTATFVGAQYNLTRVRAAIDQVKYFIAIVTKARATILPGPQALFVPTFQAVLTGRVVDAGVYAALSAAAMALDGADTTRPYTGVLAQARARGLGWQLTTLMAYQVDPTADPVLQEKIKDLVLSFADSGIRVDDIIKQGPAYLSTIPDGTYSFTVNPANTTQPVILTGTAVITSQYDNYTKRLEQKLINNNIAGTPSITALQTLDAYYNSRQVDTSGSSSTGKYTVTGNTATITSYGYSQAAGAFVHTETIIITFPAVFYVINNIINPDKSTTTISLTIYTRQLTSAELVALISGAFNAAAINGGGILTLEQAVKAGNLLAARKPGQILFDPSSFNPGDSITLERFEMAFATIFNGGTN